ncbi:unnamed protein product [Brugia timori]|uniref:Uncharacterized protein n=1 Tax=Brugia timori TaxID=42155 RepID=A0A0R3Q6V8_9BILA|nr:unnamed protein product [Brugia timori]
MDYTAVMMENTVVNSVSIGEMTDYTVVNFASTKCLLHLANLDYTEVMSVSTVDLMDCILEKMVNTVATLASTQVRHRQLVNLVCIAVTMVNTVGYSDCTVAMKDCMLDW